MARLPRICAAPLAIAAIACVRQAAAADYLFALSDGVGVYRVSTTTAAASPAPLFSFAGANAQALAEDLQGNFYTVDSTGSLLKATAPGFAVTNLGTIKTTSPASTFSTAIPRLAWDANTSRLITTATIGASSYIVSIDPASPATATTLVMSAAVAGSGDLTVVRTSATTSVAYIVATQKLTPVDLQTGSVGATVTIPGPTGSLTGVAIGADGFLYACEQVSPWTMWRFNTSGTSVTSVTGYNTGSNVVNDLAGVPVNFTVAKTPLAQTAGPRDSIVYNVKMTNTGFITIPAGGLNDPVPASVAVTGTPVCAVTGGGTCSVTSGTAQTVTATVSNLAPSAVATLTITGFTTNTSGSASNVAAANVPNDPNAGNTLTTNAAATTFTAAAMTKTSANITQGITATQATINSVPGDVIEYVLTYTNNRGLPLSSFSISDSVPANMTYVAASATCLTTPVPLTCTPSFAAGTAKWTYSGGTLAAGSSVSVKFRTTVK